MERAAICDIKKEKSLFLNVASLSSVTGGNEGLNALTGKEEVMS
jgi:hypothetical protein